MDVNNKFKELEESLKEELKKTGSVMREGKFTIYRNLVYEGYLGDLATEYWTADDWKKHNKHIEELKAKGIYGRPWICDLTLIHDPLIDHPNPIKSNMESYEYKLIDFK